MKKLSRIFWFFMFLPISFSFANNEKILFIGNPGVGKSTLINGLVGQKVATAGVKIGSGLTEFFHEYESGGISYLDTPGLEDIEMRKQAAREIEKALKQNGTYRIFFVFTLEAGRIKPADITTIDLVMDAINIARKEFNILINKLNKQEKEKLLGNETDMKGLYRQITLGRHKTDKIWYIDQDHALADGDKELMDINNDLADFVYRNSSYIKIIDSEVGLIKEHEFEAKIEEYEKQVKDLNKQLEVEKNKPPQVVYQTVHHHHDSGGGGCILQ